MALEDAPTVEVLKFDEEEAYNHDRPISSLIRTQLLHLHYAENLVVPPKARTNININHLLTERQASEYIQKVTRLLHRYGKASSPSKSKKKRKKPAKKTGSRSEKKVQRNRQKTKQPQQSVARAGEEKSVRRFMFVFLLLGGTLLAQQSTTKNIEQQDPSDEIGKFKKNCPFKHILGCAEVLFTGQPLHIAMGSIAPQNGFGAGLAYVGHKDISKWSTFWSADAVGSNNGSWRGGFFVKFVDNTHLKPPTPVFGTGSAEATDFPVYTEQPVFKLYEQSISLNKLTFFGEGAGDNDGRSVILWDD